MTYYLYETNPNVYQWLTIFIKENPIPQDGAWDDVSGDNFLRKLLSMPVEHASYNMVALEPLMPCMGAQATSSSITKLLKGMRLNFQDEQAWITRSKAEITMETNINQQVFSTV